MGVGQAGLDPGWGLSGPRRNSEPVAYTVPSSMTWTRGPTWCWGRSEAGHASTLLSYPRRCPEAQGGYTRLKPPSKTRPTTHDRGCPTRLLSPPLWGRGEGHASSRL